MMEIIQTSTPKHIKDLRDLLEEYIAWTQTFNDVEVEDIPTFKAIQDEFANLPGIFSAKHGGGFYLAYMEEQLAGCVALKKVNDQTGEIKRMYVRSDYRGQKIGWSLMQHLLEQARKFNYTKMVLDSHISMKKAHAIYQAVGFKTVPTPEDFPEKLKPVVVFMKMAL